MPASSGCSLVTPVWWKKEMNGWYVVSTSMNWRGSPLKEMRSREVRIVWRIVPSKTLEMVGHTISNTGNISIGEDTSLVVVSPVTCLFEEGGWKSVGEGPVVSEFRVDVVVDLITVDR